MFYLRKDEASNDDQLALQCLDLILNDVFKALATAWAEYLRVCEAHVGILVRYENSMSLCCR